MRLGALVANVGWGYVRRGDPPAVTVIVLAVIGAIGAMLLQRYVIIVATAFGGAWTIIVEFFALSLPYTLALTLPMSVLVSTLFAFTRLASENEITALKASGVGMS